MMLETGQPAPSFSLPNDQGTITSLEDYKGKNVVLYFYPRDDTPGCTMESCGFRDSYSEFQACNTDVIGISRDSIVSHQDFRKKYNLPFLLLSDLEGEVCQLYQAIGEKKMFGKPYQGIIRTTFLVDETGIIQAVWRNVTVNGHIPAVLQAIKG